MFGGQVGVKLLRWKVVLVYSGIEGGMEGKKGGSGIVCLFDPGL